MKKKNKLVPGERGSLRRGKPKQKLEVSIDSAEQMTHIASEKMLASRLISD